MKISADADATVSSMSAANFAIFLAARRRAGLCARAWHVCRYRDSGHYQRHCRRGDPLHHRRHVPTDTSPVYTAPLTFTTTTTLSALAAASGYADSAVTSGLYTVTITPTAATPAFTPAPGTYPDSVTVDLTCATSGAEIHYTLNGTVPTAASPLFTAPLVITTTTTVKAIAMLAGYKDSAIAVGIYTITIIRPPPPPPSLPPGASVFTGAVTVAISCATAGVTIYYTTDGSTPNTTSAVYTTPVTLTQNTTVQAYATTAGYKDSAVASSDYSSRWWRRSSRLTRLSAMSAAWTITLTCATPRRVHLLHARRHGPDARLAALHRPGDTVGQCHRQRLRRRCWHDGQRRQRRHIHHPAAGGSPAFTPTPGIYADTVTVAIADTTPNAVIHYTTDGTVPTDASAVYTGPLTFTTSTTLQALATAPGMVDSAITAGDYTVVPTVAVPTVNPAPGTYIAQVTVTLASTTPGATIYYTTDNTAPTAASPVYAAPLLLTHNTLLRAFATAPGMFDSAVTSALYRVSPQVATPVVTPGAGAYAVNVTVRVTCATPGAQLHYTLNGSTPTNTSPLYTTPLLVARSLTLSVKGMKAGLVDSVVANPTYSVQALQVATPVVTPGTGPYVGTLTVKMACATAGAEVHYTLDGSSPKRTSARYTVPLMMAINATVQAAAFKTGWADSAVATAVYTLTGDAYEPDGTPALAKPINNGQPQTHSINPIGDVDWVKFTLAQPSDVYVITDSPSLLVLSLYTAAGLVDLTHPLTRATNSLTRAGAAGLKAGVYYLQVSPTTDQFVPAYQLLLETANPGQVVTPFFSPQPGAFSAPVTVTLRCPLAGAVIRYTTDGSDPTAYDQAYTKPLVLTKTTTIKAKAFKLGYLENNMAVGMYTLGAQASSLSPR